MNTKLLPLISQIIAAIVAFSGAVGCSQQTASNPDVPIPPPANNTPPAPSGVSAANAVEPTMFKCVTQGTGFATIAQRGNAVSATPMITWNSQEFGADFTPEKRCNIVSQRLTEAVAQNGGRLAGLDLTTGKVKGLTVVCYIKQQSVCDNSNMLFTLNQQNAKNPSLVLANLMGFGNGKAGDNTTNENAYPQFIPLETVVNKVLPKDNGF